MCVTRLVLVKAVSRMSNCFTFFTRDHQITERLSVIRILGPVVQWSEDKRKAEPWCAGAVPKSIVMEFGTQSLCVRLGAPDLW